MDFTIDGKKKFTAYVVGALTSVIGLLVTTGIIGEGTADAITSVISVIAPILGAVLYDWFQSKHDIAKEYAKVQIATAGVSTQNGYQQPQETTDQKPDEFNEADFIRDIHAEAVELAENNFPDAPHLLVNVFKAAEQVGQQTQCTDIRQAVAYWNYLAGLAEDAWKQLEFETKDEHGCKLFPPQLYEARANLRRVQACHTNLQRLVQSGRDWRQAKTALHGCTLYTVGAFAQNLI